MFCQSCGKSNDEQAPFCRHCGSPLVHSSSPQVNPYAASSGPAKPTGDKPPNYLVHAILVTFCCCLPFGIVSIVYASQVDSKWASGDAQGAIQASDNAKMWFYLSLGIGLLINLVVAGIQVAAFMAQMNAMGN